MLTFGLTAIMVAVAVFLAGVRDLDASTLPDHSSSTCAHWLALRDLRTHPQTHSPYGAWMDGWGLRIRLAARWVGERGSAVSPVLPSGRGGTAASRRRGGAVKAYLGFSFLIITLLVALMAAGQVTAARREEATGRVDHLLVRPVSRAAGC